jgi:hypothetical protein
MCATEVVTDAAFQQREKEQNGVFLGFFLFLSLPSVQRAFASRCNEMCHDETVTGNPRRKSH